jgi:hypothetical protein
VPISNELPSSWWSPEIGLHLLLRAHINKDVDGNIIKLKLFPFSLRGRAKDWLLSLPRNSIDSWDKCKDAFIGKYYPPAKIIALRSDIMKF